jgi:formylmethanofuran dehydrogenase subunit C
LIHVQGNASHLVGAAYRGSAKGMTGGTILVVGNTGNEIGLLMKQGIIAIGGTAGDMIGFNMTGGTVLVLGDSGIRPGAGMHGGTIALFGPTRPPILPSFRFDRTMQTGRLVGMIRELRAMGLRTEELKMPAEVDVFVGDLVAGGTGEVFLPHLSDA